MSKPFALVAALGAALTLSACGDNLAEQGIFGAGAGAGVAAVTGGNAATGAAVGAAGNIAYCQAYPARCQ